MMPHRMAPWDIPCNEDDGSQEPNSGHKDWPRVQRRQCQEAVDGAGLAWHKGDQPRAAEADKQDEEADPDGDRLLQGQRNHVEDVLADAKKHQDRNYDPLGDDNSHRLGERESHRADQGEGNDRVEPKPRGNGEHPIRVETHSDRHDASNQAGHGGDRPRIETSPTETQDGRVDRDDVGHDHECREPGKGFSPDIRAMLRKLEIALQQRPRTGSRGALRHVAPRPVNHAVSLSQQSSDVPQDHKQL